MKEELKNLENLCGDLDSARLLLYFVQRGITICDEDILEDKITQADFVAKVSNALKCFIKILDLNVINFYNAWEAMSEIEWKKENENK